MKSNTTTTESPAPVADLKRLVAGIIRSQGNRFVKELLRDKVLIASIALVYVWRSSRGRPVAT